MKLIPAIRKYRSTGTTQLSPSMWLRTKKAQFRTLSMTWSPSLLNESKCKEMRISFVEDKAEFTPFVISEKVPGTSIGNRIVKCHKFPAKFYFPKQLKRARVATKEVIMFYTTYIHPVIEYASPVFHNSLPRYLTELHFENHLSVCHLSIGDRLKWSGHQ